MRNTCKWYRNEDFSTNPLSSNYTNKSLALHICTQRSALNSHDVADKYMQSHSLHLKSLVEDYLEPASSHYYSSCSYPNYIPHDDPHCEDHKSFIHELQTIMQNGGDGHDVELIRREVMRATKKEEISTNGEHGPPLSSSYEQLKVVVLGHLRKMGYNAAICTSKRDQDHHKKRHKGQFPTEEYEYMDMILEKASNSQVHQRLIIDLRFRSEFEIARPSTAYVELLKVVPLAYVGTPRVLQKLLKLLSEAMKKSFESQGMPLPPWRKPSFLNSKWLSPTYTRSIFASPPHTPPISTTKKSSSSISTERGNALSPISIKRDTFSSISTKRENYALSPIYAKRETLSPISSKRENALSSTNMPSFSLLSKRESSLFIINNISPIVTKPFLVVNSKHVLKSSNLATHILPSTNIIVKNNSNKKMTNQNVKPPREPWQLAPLSNPATSKPPREPWQLSPLSNPPTSVKKPRKLVGALTLALHCGSNSTTVNGPFNNLQFSLSTNLS